MQYRVEYQYRPRKSERPLDYAQDFEIAGGEDGQYLPLPNIGDHVHIEGDGYGGGFLVVENRTFAYIGKPPTCIINIVLTDSDVNGGKLIKQ